jgi:hypothetical protein
MWVFHYGTDIANVSPIPITRWLGKAMEEVFHAWMGLLHPIV